jgi:hypothetical protein
MAEGRRKLHNKELYKLRSSANITRMVMLKQDELYRACHLYAGEEECMKDYGERSRSKEATRKNRHRQEDNTRIILGKQNGLVWTGLIWIRV